jgi:DNA-directed RNA polymerase subunit RPC12/RpoP
VVDQVSAAELDDAFGLVANELRIEILRALRESPGEPLPFTALQSRVDVPDSGKFNYHLGLLVPEFVRKTDDGYLLTHAGQRIIGAAVSGVLTESGTVDLGPVPAGDCMFCGGALDARYDDGDVAVDCPECDRLIMALPVPPVVVADVAPQELPRVVSRHVLTLTQQLSRGLCKLCHGRVDATLTALSDEESVAYRPTLDVRFECRNCGDRTSLNVGATLMDHPAVTSFLFDAGIDLRESYVWELVSLLDPDESIVGEDPPRLKLAVQLDGESIALWLDESATVVDYER